MYLFSDSSEECRLNLVNLYAAVLFVLTRKEGESLMQKKRKRILGVLLSIMMITGMFPAVAAADDAGNDQPQQGSYFTVMKTDKDGAALEGAQFALWSRSGQFIETSKADGKAYFTDVVPGIYDLYEAYSPIGYIKSDDTYSVIIGEPDANTGISSIKIARNVTGVNPDYISHDNGDTIATFVNEKEDTEEVTIPIKKTIQQECNVAPEKTTFTFELLLAQERLGMSYEDGNNGLTYQVIDTCDIETDVVGTTDHQLKFDTPVSLNLTNTDGFGQNQILIREKDGNDKNWIYSGDEYHISAMMQNDENMEYSFYLVDNSSGEYMPSENAEFLNIYTAYKVSIPFTKTVTLGGSAAPGEETFELEIFDPGVSSENDYADVKRSSSVKTNGAGSYNGELVLEGPYDDVIALTCEGFFVREKDSKISNWTYSDAVWHVTPMPETDDQTADPADDQNSDDKNSMKWYIRKAVKVTDDSGEHYDPETQESHERMIFENVYTRNRSSGGGGESVKTPQLDRVNHTAFLQGYPEGTFEPEESMTRAEMTAMFARLLTEKMQADTEYPTTFTDVSSKHWAAGYIGYMQKFNIVTGYSDGKFRPDEPVTRAEFAAIASRFEKLTEGTKAFTDVKDSHWAAKYINYAATRGWVSGYPDGTFKPEDYISRAEVSAATCRILERSADQSYVKNNSAKIRTYSDVKENHWAYWYVTESSNGHEYTKSGSSEMWNEIK